MPISIGQTHHHAHLLSGETRLHSTQFGDLVAFLQQVGRQRRRVSLFLLSTNNRNSEKRRTSEIQPAKTLSIRFLCAVFW